MKNRSTIIIMIILALALLGIAVVYLTSQNNPEEDLNSPVASPTPMGETFNPTPQSESDTNNWQTLETDDFSVRYPEPVRMEDGGGTLRLVQLGPTQAEGTEIFDALVLVFETGNLTTAQQTDFRGFAESERMNVRDESPFPDITLTPLATATYGGKSGFSFRVDGGLGQGRHIYLPYGNNRYLHIFDATVDPTNQGFDQTVTQILSTLEFED